MSTIDRFGRDGREGRARILVPTDFSDPADRALEVACETASALTTIILLHVNGIDEDGGASGSTARLMAERASTVAAWGVDCEAVVLAGGRPWSRIVEYASAIGAARIVMGSHGRTGLSRLLRGSVAEQVLRHAECPVDVVPASVAVREHA